MIPRQIYRRVSRIRPNIGFVCKEAVSEEYEEELAWLLDWIKSAPTKLDKTIIFCR
ncbi:hypothetical protein DPMN_012356 [Dreissena polymorpha]|uniref:Uncharacterized protein n=1 Tax=Dreissena polymorpha TaxID=45954 RepID=A0A9D4N6U0_DREPO|nr:hypothetical protein DPMN_012356 [Dreissena polymorpha]